MEDRRKIDTDSQPVEIRLIFQKFYSPSNTGGWILRALRTRVFIWGVGT